MATQLDKSEGIGAAVPGWADIHLLASHVEQRLLTCGQGTPVDATRLRWGCDQLPRVKVCNALSYHTTKAAAQARCSVMCQTAALFL